LKCFGQCRNELHEASVELYLARAADPVRDLFERSGFLDELGEGRLFLG
jgi:hypothetical protein